MSGTIFAYLFFGFLGAIFLRQFYTALRGMPCNMPRWLVLAIIIVIVLAFVRIPAESANLVKVFGTAQQAP